jgi:integrase
VASTTHLAAVGTGPGEPAEHVPTYLRAASELAVGFRRQAASAETLRAYQGDWARFERWCAAYHLAPLPASPEALAAYLAEAANEPGLRQGQRWRYAPATLERWVAGVAWAHERAGLPSPGRHRDVRDLLAGLRRSRAAPPRRKAPVLLADLEVMLAAFETGKWPAAVGGTRNRCLLLLGWAGALRRSELAGLNVSDVRWDREDGLHLVVRSSKTDPEAEGAVVAVPFGRRPATCGPCLWARWARLLAAWDGSDGDPGNRGPESWGRRAGLMRAVRALEGQDGHVCRGPVSVFADPERPAFPPVRSNGTIGPGRLGGEAVAQVVRRVGAEAGFDPKDLAGHSLRAGFVTQALRAGASSHAVMRQTRHRDPATVEVYARERAPLVGNAVTMVGL